jgi:hypothetical protein
VTQEELDKIIARIHKMARKVGGRFIVDPVKIARIRLKPPKRCRRSANDRPTHSLPVA